MRFLIALCIAIFAEFSTAEGTQLNLQQLPLNLFPPPPHHNFLGGGEGGGLTVLFYFILL
jgi:hypothetical protein